MSVNIEVREASAVRSVEQVSGLRELDQDVGLARPASGSVCTRLLTLLALMVTLVVIHLCTHTHAALLRSFTDLEEESWCGSREE
jgi:hypothetical protein